MSFDEIRQIKRERSTLTFPQWEVRDRQKWYEAEAFINGTVAEKPVDNNYVGKSHSGKYRVRPISPSQQRRLDSMDDMDDAIAAAPEEAAAAVPAEAAPVVEAKKDEAANASAAEEEKKEEAAAAVSAEDTAVVEAKKDEDANAAGEEKTKEAASTSNSNSSKEKGPAAAAAESSARPPVFQRTTKRETRGRRCVCTESCDI